MPTAKYGKAKNRRESGAFVPIPVSVIKHPNFCMLNGTALRLLINLCSQVRFKAKMGASNNGDLTAAMEILKKSGWTSNDSINNALKELLHYGFIIKTRQGGRNLCSLYAITWWAINECNGKLDVNPTSTPPGNWKEVKSKWVRPKRKSTSLHRSCSNVTPLFGVDTS